MTDTAGVVGVGKAAGDDGVITDSRYAVWKARTSVRSWSPMRAVVFDLFHTLVDTEHVRPPGFDAVNVVATLIGAEPADFRDFWERTYIERETSPIDLVELTARYCDEAGLELGTRARSRIDAAFGVCKDDALLHPRSDVTALVATVAANGAVGVLSNCHTREVRAWSASPLAQHVTVFGRSCDIGYMKPDARSYRWMLDRLGVDAEHATFVGNGSSGELEGARAVGFGSVVHCNVFDATNGLVSVDEQRRRASSADVSVTTVDDLAGVLGPP